MFKATHALSEFSPKISRHQNCAQELLECIANPFPCVPAVLQVYRHFGVADSCEGQKFSDTCVRKLRTLASHNDVWDGHRQFGPNLCLQIAWSPMTLKRRGAIRLKPAIFTQKVMHQLWYLLELILHFKLCRNQSFSVRLILLSFTFVQQWGTLRNEEGAQRKWRMSTNRGSQRVTEERLLAPSFKIKDKAGFALLQPTAQFTSN